MGRGIERIKIFTNDTDRNDFIDRLTFLAEEDAMDVYARVIMPNHLLVETPQANLSEFMQHFLVTYTVRFN
jgi:REP element-mobilizing transposase RayT